MKTKRDLIVEIMTENALSRADRFRDEGCFVPNCESPIEELFALATWSQGEWLGHVSIDHLAVSMDDLVRKAVADPCKLTAYCGSQIAVGEYRVDFMFVQQHERDQPCSIIVVECDGHDFHERTKEQAARDKSRDRAMTASGIRVFRFTGSEIWRDANACVQQVLAVFRDDGTVATERKHRALLAEYGSEEAVTAALKIKMRDWRERPTAGLLSAW